ncbi:MAG: hypothetical protein ACO1TE_14295 [Prosthecobacter sp.]
MRLLLSGLIASCCLSISCSTKDLEVAAPGTPPIIVSQAVECTTQHNEKVTLPAGTYVAEARSSKGIYYVAPERLKTAGIIRGGEERGGLFIANEGWQWVWIGHPGFEARENETSALGKRGIIMPTHAKFEPFVPYKVARR